MSEHPAKMERARKWVSQAVAAGMDPKLLHYPPGDRQAGRWYYEADWHDYALYPGPRPDDILAEIREVLYQAGRAYDYRDGEFVKWTEAAAS